MQAVDRVVDGIMASTKGQSCSGLQRLLANPSSSLAARAARLTAGAPAVSTPAPQPTTAIGAPVNTGVVGRIAGQIEGFAFDTRAGIGVGGAGALLARDLEARL